jgi:hypothetical protein
MEVSAQLHSPTVLLPEKESSVTVGEEAGWAPEPVRRRENHLVPAESRIQAVAITAELSRIIYRLDVAKTYPSGTMEH